MPQAYVRKLAKQHGVSTAKAEGHWEAAKEAAAHEGKGDNYGYVTSIFKNMMHEAAYVPSLKDLTRGMSFKYFLVSEADGDMAPQKERSAAWNKLAKFPQFNELSFKDRREVEKDASELVDGWDEMSPEEQESIEDHLHDMVIDKMQASVPGTGVNVGDWSSTGQEDEPEEMDEPVAPPKRREREPSHIAAMRHPHEMPTADDELPDADEDGADVPHNPLGGEKKTYYKPWAALSDEQRTGRAALAKKHGMAYRVSKASWFKALDPESQAKVLNAIKSGSSDSVEKARGLLNTQPMSEGTIMKLFELMDLGSMKKDVDQNEMRNRIVKGRGNPFANSIQKRMDARKAKKAEKKAD